MLLALHKEFNVVGLVLIPIWTAMFHTETTFLLETLQILHPDSKFFPRHHIQILLQLLLLPPLDMYFFYASHPVMLYYLMVYFITV
jgi:hypothetical protein